MAVTQSGGMPTAYERTRYVFQRRALEQINQTAYLLKQTLFLSLRLSLSLFCASVCDFSAILRRFRLIFQLNVLFCGLEVTWLATYEKVRLCSGIV